MIEAVVIDLGHTLVDFALNQEALFAAHENACNLMVEHLLPVTPLTRAQIDEGMHCLERRIEESRLRQDLHELNLPAEFASCFTDPASAIPETLVDQVARLARRAVRAEMHLSPANAQALRDLRAAGFRLGLVSNISTPGDWTRELLDDLGVLEQLDVVVLSSEEGMGKPDPRIFHLALARLGLESRQAVFVGDRLREDIAGAQAVGMRAVLTRQFRREEPEPTLVNPDTIIDRLADLPAVVSVLRDMVGI